MQLTKFKDLPKKEGHPEGSAWDLFPDNELGTLNYLTEERVLGALKSVKHGKRINLNLELNQPPPSFGRKAMEHRVFQIADGRIITDDEIDINLQASTQLDGIRHYAFQKEQKFFKGYTIDQILKKGSRNLGIQLMAQAGIAGRGVLLDYARWAAKHGKDYDPCSAHPIALEDLKAVVKEQGVKFETGDLLFIRSGYTKKLLSLNADEMQTYLKTSHAVGLAQEPEMVEWLFDNHFSMLVGDTIAMECRPPIHGRMLIHETFIAGAGSPIGELFDLEELSKHCAEHSQYDFFVTAMPLNLPGGVGSPANALAIV